MKPAPSKRETTGDAPAIKRILIVDDHPIVRQGIRHLLEQEPDLRVCCEAESAGEALQALQKQKPDLAIVDISLKGTDGIELTKWIRAQDEKIPILILSMHDEKLYANRVLRAGAHGYLMKAEVADKITIAVRKVLKGEIYLSEKVGQSILQEVTGRGSAADESPIRQLSDRELEVFRLIGQGLGTREIAGQLHLSIKTIETYRAHIKDKLGLANATQLVRFAAQWTGQ
ncbi:MAG: response regulator transcription factor [Kiritimatiellae bacterium]|nr:response regulator transcription factor [Kiritimatiellia bacterium]MCO5045031.1 response regulator transcription factor [Kiritimatiellia bacterium]MCO5068711.1 response regulator transcription factor [Kiritimatiellia bacterium]